MNSGVSVSLLGFTCFCLLALLLAHSLAGRYGVTRHISLSPQLALVRLVLFFNAPVLGGAWLIALHEDRSVPEMIYMLLFAFLVFNGVAYGYFHFFNMSETARRIRMLLQIRHADAAGLRVQDLERVYSSKDMVESRLDRLVKMGQLSLGADSRYRVVGHLLLWAGGIMALWRRLVFRRVLDDRQ